MDIKLPFGISSSAVGMEKAGKMVRMEWGLGLAYPFSVTLTLSLCFKKMNSFVFLKEGIRNLPRQQLTANMLLKR